MEGSYNLYPLHVFRSVARSRSVTHAAQELFVSQPAVSKHLRTLETRLGAVLFERTSSGMLLTRAGEAVFDWANRLFAKLDELPHVVDAAGGQMPGELHSAA